MSTKAGQAPATVTHLLRSGQSLPEALGYAPETPLRLVPINSLLTIHRRRWSVEVRHGD